MRRGFWVLLLAALASAGCAHRRPLARFAFDRPEMGLPFRIVLFAHTQSEAAAASDRAFARVAELNAILSDYDDNSELSQASRNSGGPARPASRDFIAVLGKAEQVSRASDGAFDITVGPLVQVWKRARRQRELPSAAAIENARARVGWQHVHLDASHRLVRLDLPGMRLDPGGIAKGYALDEGGKVLRRLGVKRFLISGGGDMVAGDPPPGQPGWKVEVGVFDAPGAPPPRFLWLRHCGLATSGDTFQRAEIGGVRYSHIIDPRTGDALTDHRLVTIVAPDGITADALSKVASVLEPGDAFSRLRRFSGVESLVLRKPASIVLESSTPGFGRWVGVARAPMPQALQGKY